MSKIEEIEACIRNVDRFFGYVYLYLAKPVLEKFGSEGEKALRKGLRAYGRFRGQYIKKWHTELGLPINMESLLRYWDISSVRTSGVFTPESVFTPYYVEHPATHCSLYEVCKEAGFEHYGYIYCDEIHQEICMNYHPKAIVEIHECLMKNDPRCHFKWMMIPEIPEEKIDRSIYKELEKREKENPIEFALLYLKRDVRIVGILYYFLADSIIKTFGEQGKSIVTSALDKIAIRRSTDLKNRLEKKEVTWENIFDNFDLPLKYLWSTKRKACNKEYIIDVEYCPIAELWNELPNKELGALFCQRAIAPIFSELIKGTETKISKCMTLGDNKCRYEFKTQKG